MSSCGAVERAAAVVLWDPRSKVLGRLSGKPQVLICDGHGIAHPRRFGLASHVGLLASLYVRGWVPASEAAGTDLSNRTLFGYRA